MGGPWVAWPEHHVEKLRELWLAGNSAGQIANIIGAGYSRNAVIGKLSRLGLTGRTDRRTKYTTRGVRKSRKRKQPSGLPMPSPMSAFVAALAAAPVEPPPMPDAPAPADQRRSLLELEPHHCRWPIGDVREPDFHFCGAQKGRWGRTNPAAMKKGVPSASRRALASRSRFTVSAATRPSA